jgi:hypothetical protein
MISKFVVRVTNVSCALYSKCQFVLQERGCVIWKENWLLGMYPSYLCPFMRKKCVILIYPTSFNITFLAEVPKRSANSGVREAPNPRGSHFWVSFALVCNIPISSYSWSREYTMRFVETEFLHCGLKVAWRHDTPTRALALFWLGSIQGPADRKRMQQANDCDISFEFVFIY